MGGFTGWHSEPPASCAKRDAALPTGQPTKQTNIQTNLLNQLPMEGFRVLTTLYFAYTVSLLVSSKNHYIKHYHGHFVIVCQCFLH